MTTALQVQQIAARDAQADALIVGVIKGKDGPVPARGAEDVDAALGGNLAATLDALGATGAVGEVTRIASAGALAAPLVIAAGLGDSDAPDALRDAAGTAVRSLAGQAARIALSLPAADAAQAEAVALGALLGGYSFTRYRSNGKSAPREVTVLAGAAAALKGAGKAGGTADRARALATAVSLVRDLVNTSPADLYPQTLAAEAERVGRDAGLDVQVLDDRQLTDGGYGGLTGVGQGSVHGPRLVRLAYTRPGAAKTVAFVGKGITFDSGGLSLKPPSPWRS